jgi:hypothetical protein
MAPKITAQLDLDSKGFKSGVHGAAKELDGLKSKVNKFGSDTASAFKKHFGPLASDLKTVGTVAGAGIVAGVGASVALIEKSQKAYRESREAVDQLSVALKNRLGKSYSELQPQIDAVANSMEKTLGFSDEDVRKGMAQLVTSGASWTKTLSSMNVVADVAAHQHTTLAEAAKTVGLGLQGNLRGLRDFGIIIKPTGDKVKDAANAMKAFAKFQGEAAALAARDPWRATRETMGDLMETVGEQLDGPLSDMAHKLTDFATSPKAQSAAKTLGETLSKAVDTLTTKITETDWAKVFDKVGKAASTAIDVASFTAKVAADTPKGLAAVNQAAGSVTAYPKAALLKGLQGGLNLLWRAQGADPKDIAKANEKWNNMIHDKFTGAQRAATPEKLLEQNFPGRGAEAGNNAAPSAKDIQENLKQAHAVAATAVSAAERSQQWAQYNAQQKHQQDLSKLYAAASSDRQLNVMLHTTDNTHAIMAH